MSDEKEGLSPEDEAAHYADIGASVSLDEPTLGDGLYPPQYLIKSGETEQWIDDHNPFISTTPESYDWVMGLFDSQRAMVGKWKTDPFKRKMFAINIGIYLCLAVSLVSAIISVIRAAS